MNQKYKDKLLQCIKSDKFEKGNPNEWFKRSKICARRILTAVCFWEHSNNIYCLTESRIFPNIGYYYALFHMSVAVLSIDYSTNLEDLEKDKLTHKRLLMLIKDKMIKRSLLPTDYLKLYRELKGLREATSYEFKTNLKTAEYYNKVGIAFDSAIKYIKEVSEVVKNDFYLLSRISTLIGDGFGDDILEIFLSDKEQNQIWGYLINKNLTT